MSRSIVLLLLGVVAISSFASADPVAVKQAYDYRQYVPRFYGPYSFEPSLGYGIGVGAYAAIGFVFALVTMVVMIFFFMCRLCALCGCCKCCVRKPSEVGYSGRKRWLPLLALLVFGLCTCAFAAVGLSYNKNLTKYVQGSDDKSLTTLYPTLMSNALDTLDNIIRPLGFIANNIHGTVQQVMGLLSNTQVVVSAGTTGLIVRLNDLSYNIGNLTIVTPSGHSLNCSYCTSVATSISGIAGDVDNSAGAALREFRSTLSSVSDTFVNIESEITSKTGDILKTLYDVRNQTVDKDGQGKDVVDQVKTYDSQRQLGTMVLFLLPIAATALIVLATLFKSSFLFKINVWTGFLTMFFMWLLFGIHFPLSIALSDACIYSDEQQMKMANKTDDMSKIANACLQNTSLVDVYNASKQLDFADKLNFPQTYNLTQQFDFPTLNTFVSQVNALTVSTFGFNSTYYIDDPLAQLNAQLSTSYTRATIGSLDLSLYCPGASCNQVNQTKTLIVTALGDEAYLDDILDVIKANVSAVVDYKQSLMQLCIQAQDNITDMKHLADPYINTAKEFINVARCGFIGQFFNDAQYVVCSNLMYTIAILAMCLFAIAFFTTPVIILSQKAASRVPNKAKVQAAEQPVNYGGSSPLMGPATPSNGLRNRVSNLQIQVRPGQSIQMVGTPASPPPYAPYSSQPSSPVMVQPQLYSPSYGSAPGSPTPLLPAARGSVPSLAGSVPMGRGSVAQ